jgi:HDOD domain
MTDSKMPDTAEGWANYLVTKPLPSPFKVGQKVIRTLEKKSIPYAHLAKHVNKDPILAFYVMSHANDSQLEDTPSSKTLAHAISMIGLEKLVELIHEQPFKAISLKNITSFYYLRTLSTSLYAGHLGKAIAKRKGKGNPEDLYWSSLFLGTPLWYLWRFATPEMRLVRYAIRSNYKLPKIAEQEVLGGTIVEVTAALSHKLNLPSLALTCYDPDKQLSLKQWATIARSFSPEGMPLKIDDREINLLMQSPHFIVMLANLIAHYSSYCWYSRATLRAQRILANYLNCSLDEAIQLTHVAAADMSRAHPMPGVMQPAAKLFVPPRKRTKAQMKCELSHFQSDTFATKDQKTANVPKQEQAPSNMPNQNKTAVSPSQEQARKNTLEDDRQKQEKVATQKQPEAQTGIAQSAEKKEALSQNPLYTELTNIMANRPQEFTDLHELMNAATQGIAYGIELERASVGLISKDGSRFKNYYSVGCQNHESLKNFESQIVKGTIFEKLSARPASIWVKPSSDKKILDLIPMNFKSANDSKEFFLMSVFVSKKPVAIFFADNADNQTLTEAQYKQFKYLCSAVTTSLQHQASRKSPKNEE